MKLKFTARRQQKKATILVSKQTVEQAIKEANALVEQMMGQNTEDRRMDELQASVDFLSSILNKNPQQMAQDGVSTVEEYLDDAIQPQVASRVKAEVGKINKMRQAPQQVGYVPDSAVMGSKKAEAGGAGFVTDRDEKAVAKAPEKLEVPRLAADKKAQKPAATAPAAAPAPTPTPPAAAPIPENGTFDITTLSTEALAKAIKALVSIKEFEEDKSAQALIEEMTAELKTRPIEQEEPKAAPAAAPAAPAPIPAPVASRKKAESPAQAPVSLGGLNTASPEPSEPSTPAVVASDKTAVAPEGWEGTVKEMKKDKDIDNPWALSWWMKNKGYKSHEGSSEEWKSAQAAMHKELSAAFAEASKTATAQGGSWFVAYKPTEVTEDGGRTPEIGEAHSKLEDKTGIDHPETTMPIKLKEQQSLKTAADMTTNKAVREAERLGSELKNLYLGAKAITDINGSRPVREAVESIFRAADLFNEATKVLNKQQMQEDEEAEAAKIKEENKSKKSSFGGLSIAAGE